jgi:hypothetical protein
MALQTIVFGFGPPAATKGITFKLLEKCLDKVCFRAVVSDLIRQHFQVDEDFRQRALALQAERELIPCSEILNLVSQYVLPGPAVSVLGLDGGPRTAEQVLLFNEHFRTQHEGVKMLLTDFGDAPDSFFDKLFLHTQKNSDRANRVDGDKLETHRKGVSLYRQNRSDVLAAAMSSGWDILKIDPRYRSSAKVVKIAQKAELHLPCVKVVQICREMGIKPLPQKIIQAA